MLDYFFIIGLNNKKKIVLVQIYLKTSKSTVKYTKATKTIEKVYQSSVKLSFLTINAVNFPPLFFF